MADQSNIDPAGESRPRLSVVQGESERPKSAYGPQDDILDGRDLHLLEYIRTLYKRRMTAITAFLLVVGSVTVYTFTATPIFEAKTRLLIESDERNVVSFKQVIEEALGDAPVRRSGRRGFQRYGHFRARSRRNPRPVLARARVGR
jgi:hypothetical protein